MLWRELLSKCNITVKNTLTGQMEIVPVTIVIHGDASNSVLQGTMHHFYIQFSGLSVKTAYRFSHKVLLKFYFFLVPRGSIAHYTKFLRSSAALAISTLLIATIVISICGKFLPVLQAIHVCQ